MSFMISVGSYFSSLFVSFLLGGATVLGVIAYVQYKNRAKKKAP